MFNPQSKISNRKSVHPPAALRNEDRQLFIHELSFTERAPHMHAGCFPPVDAHLFTCVTAPALHERVTRKHPTIDFVELRFMQPRFGGAVDYVAVVEHEAGSIRMTEVLEPGDFHFSAR